MYSPGGAGPRTVISDQNFGARGSEKHGYIIGFGSGDVTSAKGAAWRVRMDAGTAPYVPRAEARGGFIRFGTDSLEETRATLAFVHPAGANNITDTRCWWDGSEIAASSSSSRVLATQSDTPRLFAESGTSVATDPDNGLGGPNNPKAEFNWLAFFESALSEADIRAVTTNFNILLEPA